MENKVIATFTDYHGAEFIIKKRTKGKWNIFTRVILYFKSFMTK